MKSLHSWKKTGKDILRSMTPPKNDAWRFAPTPLDDTPSDSSDSDEEFHAASQMRTRRTPLPPPLLSPDDMSAILRPKRLPFPVATHLIDINDGPRDVLGGGRGGGSAAYPGLAQPSFERPPWRDSASSTSAASDERPSVRERAQKSTEGDKFADACVRRTMKLIGSLRELIPLVKATEGKEDKEDEKDKKKGKKEKAEKKEKKEKKEKEEEKEKDKSTKGKGEKDLEAGEKKEKDKTMKGKVLNPIQDVIGCFFHELLERSIVYVVKEIGTTVTEVGRDKAPAMRSLQAVVKSVDRNVNSLIDMDQKVDSIVAEWKGEATKAKEKADAMKGDKKSKASSFYNAKMCRNQILGIIAGLTAPLAVLGATFGEKSLRYKIILGAVATAASLIAACIGIVLFRRQLVSKTVAKKVGKKGEKQQARADIYMQGVECLENLVDVTKLFKQRLVRIKMRLVKYIESGGDNDLEDGIIDRCEHLFHAASLVLKEVSMTPEIEQEYDVNNYTMTFTTAEINDYAMAFPE